jgi:hypothetical protein
LIIGTTYDTLKTGIENRLTIIATDSIGKVKWKKSYGNSKFSYLPSWGSTNMLTKSGNFYYSTLSVLDSNNRYDGVLLKFNSNGDTIWQKKQHINDSSQLFNFSLKKSVDNAFLSVGVVQTNTPSYNGHPVISTQLSKINTDGKLLWTKSYLTTDLNDAYYGCDVIQDASTKKIYIVGGQEIGNTSPALIMIVDSLGNKEAVFGTSDTAYGTFLSNVQQDFDGNLVCVGGNRESGKINGDNIYTSLIVKTDKNASILHSQKYDTVSNYNAITRCIPLSSGKLLTLGFLDVVLGKVSGFNNLLRIMMIDSDGKMIWKKYFDNYSDNLNVEMSQGIDMLADGRIVFTGNCYQCPEPAPITYMLYKTDTSSCDINAIGCFAVGIHEQKFNNNIVVYPNPTAGSVTLDNLPSYAENSTISLTNAIGEIVMRQEIISYGSQEVNLNSVVDGVYTLSVSQNREVIARCKIVVQKQ